MCAVVIESNQIQISIFICKRDPRKKKYEEKTQQTAASVAAKTKNPYTNNFHANHE